jgi:hypothetical protein
MGKRCLILRWEILILFCVYSNASIAEDSQTNPVGLSLPVETNRTRRSLIIDALGIGISLIDLTKTNIREIFDKGVAKKELRSHFQKIKNELEAQNRDLQSH